MRCLARALFLSAMFASLWCSADEAKIKAINTELEIIVERAVHGLDSAPFFGAACAQVGHWTLLHDPIPGQLARTKLFMNRDKKLLAIYFDAKEFGNFDQLKEMAPEWDLNPENYQE